MSIRLLVAKNTIGVMQRELWRISTNPNTNARLIIEGMSEEDTEETMDRMSKGIDTLQVFTTVLGMARLRLDDPCTYSLYMKDVELWAVNEQHMSLQERYFIGLPDDCCNSEMLTRWETLEAAELTLLGDLPQSFIAARRANEYAATIGWRKFLVCVATDTGKLSVIVRHAGKQLKVTHIVPRDCPTLKDVIARLKKLAEEIKELDDMLFIDKARIETLLELARQFDDEENPFLPVGTRAKIAAEVGQDVNSQAFNEAYDDVLKHM